MRQEKMTKAIDELISMKVETTIEELVKLVAIKYNIDELSLLENFNTHIETYSEIGN